jgi:hypothetical protein
MLYKRAAITPNENASVGSIGRKGRRIGRRNKGT